MCIETTLRLASGLVALLVLVGCGATATFAPAASGSGLSGRVHGGQSPVSGSTVQLLTVGTGGDQSASTVLATVISDSNGNFNFNAPNLYSCASATEVYMTATGGNPGQSAANPNLLMMTALGPCSSLAQTSFAEINEVTTVAAVSALAPYMASATAIGSGTGDVAGLNAAFTLASEYANPATGTSPGLNVPTGYVVPVAEINTLGNILAACVNSTGGTASDGSSCGSLFEYTKPASSSAPTNTIAALLNVANNPTLNTGLLFSISSAFAPFQPTLLAQPASFAVALTTSSLTLNPSSLSFGTAYLAGTTAAQSLTLANQGSAAGAVSSIMIAGLNAGDFAETNNCPASLAPGAVCAIQVQFAPTATGSRVASVMVNGSSLSSSLTGTGATPGSGPVTLSPTSLTFYEVNVPQAVTLTNYGSSTIGISGFKFSSPNYTETDNCGSSLSGQSVCTIYVSASAIGGNFTGTMTAVDSDTTDAQTVSLTTYGIYTTLDTYGEVQVGNGSSSNLFSGDTYINSSGGYDYYGYLITPNPVGVPGGWMLVGSNYSNGPSYGCTTRESDSNGTPSPTGPSCSLTINFAPTVAGLSYFEFSDNEGRSYLLKGLGVGSTPSIYVSPSALNFGSVPVGSSSNLTTTVVGNYGGSNYKFSSMTYQSGVITGLNSSDFTLTPCSSISSGFASCAFGVKFTPGGPGTRTATVTLTYVGNQSTTATQSFFVTGTGGAAAPSLASTVALGNVQLGSVGTQTVTVTMTSKDAASASVTGTGFALSGPTTCSQSAALCQFTVVFTPTALGAATGSLTVTDMVTGATGIAALTATGTATGQPVVSLSPTSLTFSPRSVGTQSIAQSVTLTNTGPAPLVISSVSLAGSNPGDYALTNGCTGTLAASGTCTMSVSNTPTFVGASSAYINIVSNATSSPNIVQISGTGQ